MLKISLRHLILSATLCLATLVANAATDNALGQPKNGGYMILKRLPMQDVADANTNTDTSTLTVVDVVDAEPSLSTLANALKAADLNATLQGPGPFTIFAPNDAAFAKLSPNALADLLKPENKDKLVTLLTYHVVPSKIESQDIKTGQVTSNNGAPLDFKADANGVTINNAHILQRDIAASNGVIHVIDTVLVP